MNFPCPRISIPSRNYRSSEQICFRSWILGTLAFVFPQRWSERFWEVKPFYRFFRNRNETNLLCVKPKMGQNLKGPSPFSLSFIQVASSPGSLKPKDGYVINTAINLLLLSHVCLVEMEWLKIKFDFKNGMVSPMNIGFKPNHTSHCVLNVFVTLSLTV